MRCTRQDDAYFVSRSLVGLSVDERLEVPRILPPAPDFVDLGDARILIADDVWRRTDLWINFPWSDQPPVVRRADAVLDA